MHHAPLSYLYKAIVIQQRPPNLQLLSTMDRTTRVALSNGWLNRSSHFPLPSPVPSYEEDCCDRPLSILLMLPPLLNVACDDEVSSAPACAIRRLALRLAASICILVCLCICLAYWDRSKGASSDEESLEKWERGD